MTTHRDDSRHTQADAADQRMTHEAGIACSSSSVVGGNRGFDAGGAPVSNTAPANCTDSLSGATVLRVGIDSLYVSCRGQISDKSENLLSVCKELARSDDPAIRAGAFLELAGHRFEVRDRGMGKYAYVLADNWFQLQVAGQSAKSLPMVYCQIRSEALAGEGPKAVLCRLAQVLVELGDVSGSLQVSRADLCADFVTGAELGAFPAAWWVARAAKSGAYSEHGRFTGYTFGQAGDISARLYDKTLECTKSKKTYFDALWRAGGWGGAQTVWRLEFQLKREPLKELGICSTAELLESLPGLWRYCTANWLQLKTPSDDQTRSRWPAHPLWSDLQAADWGEIEKSLYRVRTTREPDEHFLFINGLGSLSSFMAREGIVDPEEAISRYIEQARLYHARFNHGDYETLDAYLLEKARLKATKFNRPLPGVDSGEGEDAF